MVSPVKRTLPAQQQVHLPEKPSAGFFGFMQILICGGGVIGACTAYYLARKGVDVVVVERSGVANAASGKSGGFLALDWCRESPLDALARHSFGLHQLLATDLGRDLNLEWGYRPLETLSVVSSKRRDLSSLTGESSPDWLLCRCGRARPHRHNRDNGTTRPGTLYEGHDRRRQRQRR